MLPMIDSDALVRRMTCALRRVVVAGTVSAEVKFRLRDPVTVGHEMSWNDFEARC